MGEPRNQEAHARLKDTRNTIHGLNRVIMGIEPLLDDNPEDLNLNLADIVRALEVYSEEIENGVAGALNLLEGNDPDPGGRPERKTPRKGGVTKFPTE